MNNTNRQGGCFALGCLLILPLLTQAASPVAPIKMQAKPSLGSNQYEAQLGKPVPGQKRVNTKGLVWLCEGATCSASGPSRKPSKSACAELQQRVGPISYCGPERSKGMAAEIGAKPVLRMSQPQSIPAPKPTPPQDTAVTLKTPIKPQPKLMPKRPVPGAGGFTPVPGQPERAPLRLPAVVTTARLMVVGNPDVPGAALAPFSPIQVTTAALLVQGNPELPEPPTDSFIPITVTTSPLSVIGSPIQ